MRVKPPTGSSNKELFEFCQDVAKLLSGNISLGIQSDSNGPPDFLTNSSTNGSHTLKNDPSKQWHINTDGNGAINIVNTATYSLAPGSGIVTIIDENTGNGAIYLCAGGTVYKLGGVASYIVGVPGAGQLGLYISFVVPIHYEFQNNTGATVAAHISLINVRTNT